MYSFNFKWFLQVYTVIIAFGKIDWLVLVINLITVLKIICLAVDVTLVPKEVDNGCDII